MRAEELSVGNFVYLKNGKLFQGLQVTGIGDSFVNLKMSDEYPNVLYPLNNIEQIPLTAEIFEKNGFELCKESWTSNYRFYFNKDKRVQISDLTNSGDGYWNVHVDNEDNETIGSCDVKYVHEMQNILRLCKYELDLKI